MKIPHLPQLKLKLQRGPLTQMTVTAWWWNFRSMHIPLHSMETMKKRIQVGEKMVCDTEVLFSQMLIVGQIRNIRLTYVFEYELCRVPSSTLNKFGLLCKCQICEQICNHFNWSLSPRWGNLWCQSAAIPYYLALWRYSIYLGYNLGDYTSSVQRNSNKGDLLPLWEHVI